MFKSDSSSIYDITEKELSNARIHDELNKLKKQVEKQNFAIDEYKEREKASARALVLYERKIKYLKQKTIDEILSICETIENKILNLNMLDENNQLAERNESALSLEEIANKLYSLCNMVEVNAGISNEDRAFISNKPAPSKPVKNDINSRFDRLKEEFNQKIGESVLRKPGRPKKQDQSIVSDIGLGKKINSSAELDESAKAKINEIFYETPKNTGTMSNIPLSNDAIFDFDEALNPNLSLASIMEDLMSEKPSEPPKTYSRVDLNKQSLAEAQVGDGANKSKVDMLESGIMNNVSLKSGGMNKKPNQNITFEKRFMSLSNLFTDDE